VNIARPSDSGPPTVADVARVAGVSRQTVSNVLNAPDRVRPETRERVERAITELGYLPNRMAQALRAQTSKLIGYCVEPVHEQSLGNIHDRFLHALAEAGRAADHHLLLFTADNTRDEVAACARLHRAGAIDGVVLYKITHADPRPAGLTQLGVPFAAFGRTGADDHHPWVDVDNAAGTVAAVEHLLARGHRRIAFVGVPEGSAPSDRRAEGWRTGLDKAGLLDASRHLDLRGEDTVANGARLAGALLDQPEPPTAIVTATDTLAVGALQTLRARGLTAGRDVAVVGFDDTPTAAVLDLSSVRQPIEAVGREIVRSLLHRMRGGGPTDDTSRLLDPTLVVRASSAAPPS
jgi:DNA-binding LacI/PurR family transcriptional regulator